MVTKPLKNFVDHKVKSYVHWELEEWNFIRDHAKNLNIPPHWIVKEMRNFLTSSDALKEEFEKHLHEKFTNHVIAQLSNAVTRDARFLKSILRCPFCVTHPPCSEFHIKSMHRNQYKAWKEASEVPLVVEVRSRH